MLTMILGGLWHGAAWTFVIWGAFHGAGLAVERALGGRLPGPRWLKWLVTFHLVVLGWILFRSQSIGLAVEFLGQLVQPGAATLWSAPVAVAIVLVIGLQLVPPRPVDRLQIAVARLRPVVLAVGLALVMAFAGATVSSQGVAPFIYFRF
jgi:alginate O-acetyltransferase complex protein AlgI